MDDGLEFSRSQEEEAKTARVIRKCGKQFNRFITKLDSLHASRTTSRLAHHSRSGSTSPTFTPTPSPTPTPTQGMATLLVDTSPEVCYS